MTNFPKSDLDNADRFVEEHGKYVRYCIEWDKWVMWDGSRWRIDAESIFQKAGETVRGLMDEAKLISDKKDRKEAERLSLRSQSEHGIKAMLNLAKHKVAIKAREFDRNNWLLNTVLGKVDLRTGELLEHDPKDFITKMTRIPYVPEWGKKVDFITLRPPLIYHCPLWLNFLDRVLRGNRNLIRYVQEAVGYSLTGDISEQCFFLLYGTKACALDTVYILFLAEKV